MHNDLKTVGIFLHIGAANFARNSTWRSQHPSNNSSIISAWCWEEILSLATEIGQANLCRKGQCYAMFAHAPAPDELRATMRRPGHAQTEMLALQGNAFWSASRRYTATPERHPDSCEKRLTRKEIVQSAQSGQSTSSSASAVALHGSSVPPAAFSSLVGKPILLTRASGTCR